MRVIHGIAVGAVLSGKRAFFVDVYSGDKLKNYLSLLSIIWSTGPIIAPFAGGWLQIYFGWRANFYVLALIAVIFFVLELVFSGETLARPSRFEWRKIAGIYAAMLRSAPFVLGISLMGLAGGIIMVYNMTGPFIVEHYLQLSPVIAGYCSLVMGLAWMTGGFIGKATVLMGLLGIAFVVISASSYGMVNVFAARDAQNLGYSYLVLVLASLVVLFIAARGSVVMKKRVMA